MANEPAVDVGIGEEDGEKVGACVQDDRSEEDAAAFIGPGHAEAEKEGVDALVEVAVVDGEGQTGQKGGRPKGQFVPQTAEHQRAEDELFTEGADER